MPDCSEVVERQIKVCGQQVEAIQSDACALVRNVTNMTGENAGLTGNEQQCIPVDASSTDRPPFSSLLLKYLLDGRHSWAPENQTVLAERSR